MVQLLLVRHGEPSAADAVGPEGADPPLTDAGHRQAERFADWLAAAPERDAVAEVVVSPMRRARESAAPAASALGLEPVVSEGLAEYDRGHHSYRPERELVASGDPDWTRVRAGWFPAFVDVDAFTARVLDGFAAVLGRHGGRSTVVVVCHGGVINTYLASILDLARPLLFPLEHLSVSRVLVSATGERRVRSVNETQHMAGDR